jgi:P-type E1-E2 ATPase
MYYYYMAITWTIVILSGALTVAYFQYKNDVSLYTISVVEGEVEVTRDGKRMSIPQEDVVPGDLVHVTPGKAYCDMVILSAGNIIIDESALTGEATPMSKKAINVVEDGQQTYSCSHHKRHTIMAGTSVLEAEDVIAVVIATSSYSTRGEMIRDIFCYQRNQFKFDVEIPIVLTILMFYAIFGFAMVIYFLKESPVYGWFYGM